jgi:hypothetical protein
MLDSIPNTSQRTAYGPDDVGSGCPAVPPLGWQSRLGGRLGLRRRPKPTRTTPSTEADSDYAVDRSRLGRRPEPTRTTPSTGADSDYIVDRSRLGLVHRRPERPTRDTCLYATGRGTPWTCRVAREALPHGPLPGTSESTGVMSRLPEAVPGRSRSRTPRTTSSSARVRVCVSSRLLTSPDSVWNRAISGAGVRIVGRPWRWYVA